MSELKAKLKKSLTESMKARQADRTQTIRMALTAIQKKEIDTSKDLTDPEAEKVLLTMMKQLQESLEQAKAANRNDLAEAAEKEIVLVKEFLPQQLSEADVTAKIEGIVAQLKSSGQLPAGGAAMGMVMKQAQAALGSQAEGKVISAAVKKALGI